MITPDDLQNRAVALTPRQHQAVELVERYIQTLGEPPSYGWLARRFGISRQGAAELMQRVRDRRDRRRPLTE
jgi:predicted 3-demethylubiquinone-9 3-methyltransferase (glyoxalase superfamily)